MQLTASLKIRLTLALVLAAGGALVYQHPDAVAFTIDSATGWLGFKSTVVQAVIVEKSSDRSKLPQSQIIVIQKAGELGIKVVDQNVLDPAGNVPSVLAPFLAAAKGKPLPQLVRKWASGRITSVALPPSFDKLRETK